MIKNEREVLKTQLVCTFTRKYQVEETIADITRNFSILNNKIFQFKSFETREDQMPESGTKQPGEVFLNKKLQYKYKCDTM